MKQHIKELEKEFSALNSQEKISLLMSDAVASSINAIGITDLQGKIIFVNHSCVKMWGYNDHKEVLGTSLLDFWEGDGIHNTIKQLMENGSASGEDIGIKKDGSLFTVQFRANLFADETGNPAYMFGSFIDITSRKKADENLQKANDKLKQTTTSLEETNIALRVLLEQQVVEKKKLEREVLNNVSNFVLPYLEKLMDGSLNSRQTKYLSIIENNLKELTRPFVQESPDILSILSPSEIQVANFTKQGKTTKDIANVLTLSPATIATHKQRIRKKLGLTNKKLNLRTFLTTNKI